MRVPDGYTSASFAELVLEQAAVVVAPGPSYGPSGEGFVRISLTVADDRLEEAVARIRASVGEPLGKPPGSREPPPPVRSTDGPSGAGILSP